MRDDSVISCGDKTLLLHILIVALLPIALPLYGVLSKEERETVSRTLEKAGYNINLALALLMK